MYFLCSLYNFYVIVSGYFCMVVVLKCNFYCSLLFWLININDENCKEGIYIDNIIKCIKISWNCKDFNSVC